MQEARILQAKLSLMTAVGARHFQVLIRGVDYRGNPVGAQPKPRSKSHGENKDCYSRSWCHRSINTGCQCSGTIQSGTPARAATQSQGDTRAVTWFTMCVSDRGRAPPPDQSGKTQAQT